MVGGQLEVRRIDAGRGGFRKAGEIVFDDDLAFDHHFAVGAADQDVVAGAANQRVVAGIAENLVVRVAAGDGVVAIERVVGSAGPVIGVVVVENDGVVALGEQRRRRGLDQADVIDVAAAPVVGADGAEFEPGRVAGALELIGEGLPVHAPAAVGGDDVDDLSVPEHLDTVGMRAAEGRCGIAEAQQEGGAVGGGDVLVNGAVGVARAAAVEFDIALAVGGRAPGAGNHVRAGTVRHLPAQHLGSAARGVAVVMMMVVVMAAASGRGGDVFETAVLNQVLAAGRIGHGSSSLLELFRGIARIPPDNRGFSAYLSPPGA